jgi:hypothetical protein
LLLESVQVEHLMSAVGLVQQVSQEGYRLLKFRGLSIDISLTGFEVEPPTLLFIRNALTFCRPPLLVGVPKGLSGRPRSR